MGWSIGYDENWQRDIGYGVPATCDHPGCNEKIDRGLAHVCAHQQPYGGEEGCGLYFCYDHLTGGMCERWMARISPHSKRNQIISTGSSGNSPTPVGACGVMKNLPR